MIKRIGVFTSGGDAPGMNAAVRAVTRTALYHRIKVSGIYRGYNGLIEGDFTELNDTSVSNIIQRGGTILQSARSDEFRTKAGMAKAYEKIKKQNIDAIVAIGGDGTFRGALEFSKLYSIPFIGLPGTIDNDLSGTDFTIGYDTALNTVVQAVDKIRDTASSHNRLFFIEVMGRDAGFIALNSGLATGAEDILIPETKTYIDELTHRLEFEWRKNKTSAIIIVAEGDDEGGAIEIAQKVKEKFDFYKTRVTILGHIQRGGSPTCNDRVLASRLGFEAVEALMKNISNVMVGIINKEIVYTPFSQSIKTEGKINRHLLDVSRILSL